MKTPRPFSEPGPGAGYQPVRFLQPLLLGAFENAAPGFLDLLRDQIQHRGANPAVNYEMTEGAAEGPYIQGINGSIWLQETFLSYLWGVCYGALVVYDEALVRPRITSGYVRSAEQQELIDGATALFDYALSLFKRFNRWPLTQLPNPEMYSPIEAHYVSKADAAFVMATVFIMLHEYAHFYLGHLEEDAIQAAGSPPPPSEERKADEFAADRYAIETMLEGAAAANPETAYTMRCGIVLGLGAILLPHTTLDGGAEHPDPHQRLRAGLLLLGQDPVDNLWGLGAMLLALWSSMQGKPAVGGHPYTSLQELFTISLGQLDDPRYHSA